MIFIERIIYQALTNGLEEFKAKPTLFFQFLVDGGISEEEATRQQAYFEEHPPEIYHGYARADAQFPCYVITLGSESIETDYLDEDANPLDYDGEQYFDENGSPVDYHVRRWNHTFQVWTYADHPDVCIFYYYLSRFIIQQARTYFQQNDLDEMILSGAELTPDPRYQPSPMFIRQLTITIKSDDVYQEKLNPGVGRGRTITGIEADDSSDAGVTPY